MEAALAELSIDDVKDEADDKDFVVVKDEEDVFESDFESTDDEAEAVQEIPDSGEKQVRAEERREKKVISSVFSELVKLSYNIGSPKSV